jgi:type IX secretion system PorP/SprF family membrane protein
MRKIAFIFLFVWAFVGLKAQHGAMYSQYMFNGLLINPAYAGSNEVLSATLLTRNQWVGFDGAPKTTTLSMHSPLRSKKVNLGITISNDQYGITKQNKINAVYAYRLFLKNGSLAFGVQAGINMIRNNWSHISTTTAGDQVFTNQYSQQNIPESGFGVYYKNQKFFAGASAPDLLTLKKVSGILYKPMLLSAGYLFTVSEELKIKPSFVFKYIRNSPVEVDLNANAYFKAFGLGLSYRTKDAIVFMASYNINEQFTAGYSYDLTISKLRTYVKSTHEIMLKYEFGFKVHPQSPRYF